MASELLKVRNDLKSKKPTFLRTDIHKKKKLAPKWRRPKGWQNKMRLHKRGYRRCVSVGWSSPKAVRGLSRDGKELVVVNTSSDLEGLDKDIHMVILAKNLGMKKKIALLNKVNEAGLSVFFYKDAKTAVSDLESKKADLKKTNEAAKARSQKRVDAFNKAQEVKKEKKAAAPKKKAVVKKAAKSDDKKADVKAEAKKAPTKAADKKDE